MIDLGGVLRRSRIPPAARPRPPPGPPDAQPLGDRLAEGTDLLGQLDRAAGRLAEPERYRGRRALGVHDPHHARLDPADPPRGGAEQEHVAGHGLDRPVLVHGPDQGAVRLGQDPVVTQLGDRPARGERGQAGAPAAGQPPGHPVPVQVGGPAAAAGPDPLRDQLGDLVEVLGRQARERGGPPDQGQQVVLGPVLGRALRHDLLGQDVQRAVRDLQGVEPAGPHAAQQRRGFHQLVAGRRVQPPGRYPAAAVVGPADPLEEGGEAAGRADLAHQLDRPDVDPQLQRRGRDQGPQVTAAQP